jgi:two-component system, NarL family, sensor histidine kinase DesK
MELTEEKSCSETEEESCSGRLVDGPLASHPPAVRSAAMVIWAGFVLFPLVDAIATSGSTGHRAVTLALAAVFVAGYVYMIVSFRLRRPDRLMAPVMAVMLVTASVLTVGFQQNWGYLFSYCAACGSLLPRDRDTGVAVVLSTVLAVVMPLLGGANGGTALGLGASAAGVGFIMILVRDLRQSNDELRMARSEIARLAVAEERERFARDLHDLLGHSLSVIAIKAELARRVLPTDPERSGAEVADIESVARSALNEVREAAAGYRRPTLDGELEGARVALTAAGVECKIDRDRDEVDPETEAVLAWAVREGATNVIRHSTAHLCVLRITSAPDSTAVEVVDDGSAATLESQAASGHGLAGLRERVTALRGTMAAGPLASGGYRLSVVLPRSGLSA